MLQPARSQFVYEPAGIFPIDHLSSQSWRPVQAPNRRGAFMFRFVCFVASLSLAGSLSAQVEPTAGRWKTWVIPSGGTLRLAAPPNDATTAAEILQIKSAISQLDTATIEQIHF